MLTNGPGAEADLQAVQAITAITPGEDSSNLGSRGCKACSEQSPPCREQAPDEDSSNLAAGSGEDEGGVQAAVKNSSCRHALDTAQAVGASSPSARRVTVFGPGPATPRDQSDPWPY